MHNGHLQIKSESKKVWKFIIDREIEAPARFQAIQSYRCAPIHPVPPQCNCLPNFYCHKQMHRSFLLIGTCMFPIVLLTKMRYCVCRAAMAIMRQQANFVEQLYSSGMVDEQEQEQLLEPIEAQERRLERKGAVWRAPKIVEVGASSVIQI